MEMTYRPENRQGQQHRQRDALAPQSRQDKYEKESHTQCSIPGLYASATRAMFLIPLLAGSVRSAHPSRLVPEAPILRPNST